MSVLVVGNTDYSIMLAAYLEDSKIHVDAFSVDEKFIQEDMIFSKPVVPTEKLPDFYAPHTTDLYMGIGYSKLGRVKQEVFLKLKAKGYRFENYIHPTAVIHKDVRLGTGNVFFENVVVQRKAVIGDGNLFFSNAVIMHDNQVGSFNTFCACSVSNGDVVYDDCNFIGANATIRNGVVIASDCLIGAGAYVNHNCQVDTAVLPPSVMVANKAKALSNSL